MTDTDDADTLQATVLEALEDCWDTDCNACTLLAPNPCPEHLDLEKMAAAVVAAIGSRS